MTGVMLRRPVLTVLMLYVAALLLWQRDWLLSGEMYAEMATNYFAYARSSDLGTVLFSLDSGYFPLPQRLLAGLVHLAGINAATVPYVYMAVAACGAALLAGSFAHPVFRTLVRCDLVRVAVALVLLGSLDIESRGFINFTYLVVVFATVTAALVCLERRGALPWWCWTLPPLMLSKPHVLVVVPIAAVAAVLARGRDRLLMALMVVAGLVQAGVLAMSARAGQGDGFNAPGLTLTTKLRDAVYYGFGLAGGDVLGPWAFQPDGRRALLAYGLALCVAALAAWWASRKAAWAGATWLMLAGLALAVGSGAFNGLTLTTLWDADFKQLATPGIYRHRVTAFAGALLFVAGACQAAASWLASRQSSSQDSTRFWPAALLAVWFWGTATYIYPRLIEDATIYPLASTGTWQRMAGVIDRPGQTACVPVDPLGWSFQQNCVTLTHVSPPVATVPIAGEAGVPGAAIPAPDPVGSFHVLALGISVRPALPTMQMVRMRAVVEHAGGSSVFQGDAMLRPGGIQVLLTGSDPAGVAGVRSIRLESETPLLLFVSGPAEARVPTIAWMGR